MEFKPFEKKVWLASPTMHGDEMMYIKKAYESNWMSTVGENINELERIAAQKAQMKYANKIGAKNTVVLGSDEIASGKANIKNMETHEQVEMPLDKIADYFLEK